MSHDTTTSGTAPDHAPDTLEEAWDEEWLAAPKRHSRWRAALLATLAVSLVFLGGIQVEKHWGTTGNGGSQGAAGSLPSGFPTGGQNGFPGLPGSGGTGSNGSGDGQTDNSGSGTSTEATQVIGTVIAKHGTVWTVQDLGGTKHTITVSGETPITRELRVKGSAVKDGTTVDITLTTGTPDTASSVTVR